MKDKWRNYALKDGKIKSSYIREYCNRKKSRKAGEASDCNSFLESGKEQQEEKVINESIRKENPSEAHQEGRQGVSGSDQRRYEAQETNHEEDGAEEMKKQTAMDKKHESKGMKKEERKEKREERKEERKKK